MSEPQAKAGVHSHYSCNFTINALPQYIHNIDIQMFKESFNMFDTEA